MFTTKTTLFLFLQWIPLKKFSILKYNLQVMSVYRKKLKTIDWSFNLMFEENLKILKFYYKYNTA